MYEKVLRPLLFRMDAERAHNWGLSLIAKGLIRTRLVHDPRLAIQAMGMDFAHPLGLAAGFDKNAVAVNQWRNLGFSYAEIGTVTARPQPGNPQPRLFRLPAEGAIINRFGFNSEGAERVAQRLREAKPGIPLGVNLGKNKETPAADAPQDYAYGAALLAPHADYLVLNVSSPNTPGLRTLQGAGPIRDMVQAIRAVEPGKPILLKLAPDLAEAEFLELVSQAPELGLAGLILTNTTVDRSMLTNDPGEAGGLSGRPLRAMAQRAIVAARDVVPLDYPLIGVGGLFTGEDVLERMKAGANLVQLYSGWVYGGPATCSRILLDILRELNRSQAPTLADWARS